jgi:hypothetical protein
LRVLDALRLVIEDAVSPFSDADAKVAVEFGCGVTWPYEEDARLIELYIPWDVCDGKVVTALVQRGHRNLKRRRDL